MRLDLHGKLSPGRVLALALSSRPLAGTLAGGDDVPWYFGGATAIVVLLRVDKLEEVRSKLSMASQCCTMSPAMHHHHHHPTLDPSTAIA